MISLPLAFDRLVLFHRSWRVVLFIAVPPINVLVLLSLVPTVANAALLCRSGALIVFVYPIAIVSVVVIIVIPVVSDSPAPFLGTKNRVSLGQSTLTDATKVERPPGNKHPQVVSSINSFELCLVDQLHNLVIC